MAEYQTNLSLPLLNLEKQLEEAQIKIKTQPTPMLYTLASTVLLLEGSQYVLALAFTLILSFLGNGIIPIL